jgi:hypothetical protein
MVMIARMFPLIANSPDKLTTARATGFDLHTRDVQVGVPCTR